jgi:cytidylate kinase
MAVITLSREYGSMGEKIGRAVAERLGYRFVNKETLSQVLSQYGLVLFKDFYDKDHGILDLLDSRTQDFIETLEKAIKAFAKEDNIVIMGRGGFAVLQGYENVLNVFIGAPFEHRVKNVLKTMDKPDKDAAEVEVMRHDRSRKSFLRYYYDQKCESTSSFTLAFDTSKVPEEKAIEWIIETVQLVEGKEIQPEFSTLGIEVDASMASAIERVLEEG